MNTIRSCACLKLLRFFLSQQLKGSHHLTNSDQKLLEIANLRHPKNHLHFYSCFLVRLCQDLCFNEFFVFQSYRNCEAFFSLWETRHVSLSFNRLLLAKNYLEIMQDKLLSGHGLKLWDTPQNFLQYWIHALTDPHLKLSQIQSRCLKRNPVTLKYQHYSIWSLLKAFLPHW